MARRGRRDRSSAPGRPAGRIREPAGRPKPAVRSYEKGGGAARRPVLRRVLLWAAGLLVLLPLAVILLYRVVPPPVTPLMLIRLAERSEEHTSELQSLMRISYAVFCLK